MTSLLTSQEPFIVQAHFKLQGIEDLFHTSQEFSYQIKVYANEITSGKSKLLTTHNGKLIRDVLEYTASVELPGLPLGLYRLFTVVILGIPIKVAQFYGKTIVQKA